MSSPHHDVHDDGHHHQSKDFSTTTIPQSPTPPYPSHETSPVIIPMQYQQQSPSMQNDQLPPPPPMASTTTANSYIIVQQQTVPTTTTSSSSNYFAEIFNIKHPQDIAPVVYDKWTKAMNSPIVAVIIAVFLLVPVTMIVIGARNYLLCPILPLPNWLIYFGAMWILKAATYFYYRSQSTTTVNLPDIFLWCLLLVGQLVGSSFVYYIRELRALTPTDELANAVCLNSPYILAFIVVTAFSVIIGIVIISLIIIYVNVSCIRRN